ncbi:hypothetical protein [Gaoshiqia sp. Z1-71]|uniref:hypothetical protein n=1 Tax=Gaoshiqia hydrogeniformans TaxID=3290090 RepID=UPI003BF86E00
MKSLFILLLLLVPALHVLSQEQKFTLEAELLFHSRHLWRGMQFGHAPTAEPSVTLGKGRFSFNLWAAKTFDDSYAEIDLIPSFRLNGLEISLMDYYNPVPGTDNHFFNLKDGQHRHSTELVISQEQTEKWPLRCLAGVFFFGDKNPGTGKPYYSTYAELAYPFCSFNLQFEPAVGFTTHEGYYAHQFAIINTGFKIKKEFRISQSLIIPVRFSAIHNPYQDKLFFSVAGGFKLP